MNNKSGTNKFIHASLWTALNSYCFFIINFIGQIILAKLLLPENYGVYAFALALVEICIIFLGFSNTSAFINSEGTQEDFNACFKLNLISTAVLSLIGVSGLLMTVIMSKSIEHGFLFLLLCLSQIFLLFGNVFMAPLQKTLNFKKVSFYNGACSSGSLAIGIVLAKCHFLYWSLGLRDLLNYVFFFFIAYRICPMRINKSFFQASHKSQLSFGLKISFSRAMEIVYYRFSDVLIKLTMGKTILGNFYQARTVSYYPIKLMEPVTHQVLFSFFSTMKHDKALIADRLNWINFIITRVFIPFIFFIMLYGKSLFIFIYGIQWQLAGTYFECFSFWIPIASLFAAALSTCYSLEKQWIASIGYIIAFIIFILSMIFFRTVLPPPVFFSVGLFVGYAFLLLLLKKSGLDLKITKIFLSPVLVLCAALVFHRYNHQAFTIIFFIFCYILLFFFEKKRWILIYKKIRRLSVKRDINQLSS